jgi:acyl-homoserine lactone synthase
MSVIHIVTSDNDCFYRDEMEQAYRLRHQVFIKEMGWTDLAKPDGREIDQFDDEHAVHMLYIDQGQVLGYQRMLPSTRARTSCRKSCRNYAKASDPSDPISGSAHATASRQAIGKRGASRARSLTRFYPALWNGDWGVGSRRRSSKSTLFCCCVWSSFIFRMLPLGLPRRMANQDVVAVTATFDWRTLERLREMRGNRCRVLAESFEQPALLRA